MDLKSGWVEVGPARGRRGGVQLEVGDGTDGSRGRSVDLHLSTEEADALGYALLRAASEVRRANTVAR